MRQRGRRVQLFALVLEPGGGRVDVEIGSELQEIRSVSPSARYRVLDRRTQAFVRVSNCSRSRIRPTSRSSTGCLVAESTEILWVLF